MTPIFALQPIPKSIFLAGPTPRDPHVPSWRPAALDLLTTMGFHGAVYVPESENWEPHDHYDSQVDWEWEALNASTVVVFWIPRHLETLPAFTPNVEFGLSIQSGKVVLGYPEGAPKNKYLDRLAKRYGAPVFHTLEETLRAAVEKTKQPFQ